MNEESKKITAKPVFNPIKNEAMLFFFITPLGLEEIIRHDVLELLKNHGRTFELKESTKGGFEIKMCFLELFDLIPHMKGLTRILMRLGNEEEPKLYKTIVRDYPKLFQKISKYPWEHFLFGELPTIEVSTKNSRIFDSRKIEKAIHEGIERHYQMKPVKAIYLEKKAQLSSNTLFVRIIDDELTLSIDLVGERLDRRFDKVLTSKAPLRESIAHALAKKSFSLIDKNQLPIILIDPFVGSGTMIKESLELNTPTFKRFQNEDYAFFHFPAFDKWKKSPEFKIHKERFDFYKTENPVAHFVARAYASDLDADMLKIAKTNLAHTNEMFQTPVHFEKKDATAFSFLKSTEEATFIFTNPPYGERIELKNSRGETLSTQHFLTNLLNDFRRERIDYVGLVSTSEQTRTIKKSPDYEILFRQIFKNGGLDVEYVLVKNTF